MSDTPTTDRQWMTRVNRKQAGYAGPIAYTYVHRGPAEFKLDAEGNLRVEVYPENSDFEVVIALHLAGTFDSVSQEELYEPEEDDDENCPCEDCGDGEPELDPDREIQVHDPDAQEW